MTEQTIEEVLRELDREFQERTKPIWLGFSYRLRIRKWKKRIEPFIVSEKVGFT